MKTTKQHAIFTVLLACLLAFSNAVQAKAVGYQSIYHGNTRSDASMNSVDAYSGLSTTSSPSASFQSTSVLSRQFGNETTTPMLNADGTVNNEAYGVGQRNAPGARKAPGTPGGNLDPNTQQPLGDAVLPLIIIACAYTLIRVRKKYIGGTIL